MRILLSNDDGYHAPGIQCLAMVLRQIADVVIVAPDRDQSGASNSLTLDRPLKVTQLEQDCYYVNGTPTDCVHLALTGLLDKLPDMVVSGINRGANLGDDILYSGTIAAAVEGRYLGLPSIAVSLARPAKHYQTAAEIIKDLVIKIYNKPLSSHTILNVNIPDIKKEEVQGVEFTRFGKRHPSDAMIPAIDPRGLKYYWIGLPGVAEDDGIGSDFHAINNHKVSITPFHLDWTDYASFDLLKTWFEGK